MLNRQGQFRRATAAIAWAALMIHVVGAQDGQAPPLFEQEPFDILVLTPPHDSARLEIFPTSFPNRRFEKGRGAPLRVRLLAYPDREFDVDWSDVATVEVYEDLLVAAARKEIEAKRFDSAYRHLERLADEASDWPGLDEALLMLMRADAVAAFRDGRLIQALGTVDLLFTANPDAPATVAVLSAIADRIFNQYLRRAKFVPAREMIDRVENRYGPQRVRKVVAGWKKKLSELSEEYVARARQLESDPPAALDQIEQARKLWPDSAGAAELAAELAGRYPRVVVGVTRVAADRSYWNEWTSRRTGRLLRRALTEAVGVDSDGARYQPLLGTVELREGGRVIAYELDQKRLDLQAAAVTKYDLAERIFGSIDPNQPDYLPRWQQALEAIDVSQQGLVIRLKQPLLRAEAFLALPLGDLPSSEAPRLATWLNLMPYSETERGRFKLNQNYAFRQPTQPVEIVERPYESGIELAAALRTGDIHVADRLTPVDIESLHDLPGVMTRPYLFPSVHFLLPNTAATDSPINDRNFRRAVTFMINRQAILEQDLLSGRAVSGCRQISGPFAPGQDADDPLAYAYDESILPRRYDPSLGVTLASLAAREFARQAEKRGEDVPQRRAPLILAHPRDPLCRAACSAIVGYLHAATIDCETLELPVGSAVPEESVSWDLLYVDTVLSEPVVDVHRIFGPGGLMTQTSPYLQSALYRLAETTVWADAREILREMHRITHDEVTVIPLWQWTDYYAHSAYVTGVHRNAVTLYQDVENWRVDPEGAF